MPGYANPQNLNRYSYVTNNPLRYIDPTGHKAVCGEYGETCSEDELDALTGGGGSNEGNNNNHEGSSGASSTLIHDFQSFPEIQWFTGVVPIDLAQMQRFCTRNFGADVECGRFLVIGPGTLNGINLRIDAIGIRIEASGWIVNGGDINIDWLYFGTSNETGLFLSPGSQTGGGGGAALTGGLLIGQNMPGRGSYSGVSTYGGGHVPVLPLGIDLEGEHSVSVSPNANGTYPATTYIGAGPIGEAGGYTGVSATVSVTDMWTSAWNWLTGR